MAEANPFQSNQIQLGTASSMLASTDIFHGAKKKQIVPINASIESRVMSVPYPISMISCVVLPGYKIESQWIGNFFRHQELLINVSCVISPSALWFSLKSGKSYESFRKLRKELLSFYSMNSLNMRMKVTDVIVGHFCVIMYNNEYHRARIYSFQIENNEIYCDLFHIDYGILSRCTLDKCFYLLKPFAALPRQAIIGGLANIRPLDGKKWPELAAVRLSSLVINKNIKAQVVQVKPDLQKIYVFMTDMTHPYREICINDSLIDADLAKIGSTFDYNLM